MRKIFLRLFGVIFLLVLFYPAPKTANAASCEILDTTERIAAVNEVFRFRMKGPPNKTYNLLLEATVYPVSGGTRTESYQLRRSLPTGNPGVWRDDIIVDVITIYDTARGDLGDPNIKMVLNWPTMRGKNLVGPLILREVGGGDACRSSFDFTLSSTPLGGTGGPVYEPETCPGGTSDKPIVKTAIGCIPTEPGGFVSFLLKYLIGLGGMVAFFLILAAGFQILTSSGNPEKLEGAKQLLTSAIIGLFFIVFSVVILQIIGVNILGNPPGFPGFQ